jgi:hypothetical protein
MRVIDANRVKNEVTSILAGISQDEKSLGFDWSIERCHLLPNMKQTILAAEKNLVDFAFRHRHQRIRCKVLIGRLIMAQCSRNPAETIERKTQIHRK